MALTTGAFAQDSAPTKLTAPAGNDDNTVAAQPISTQTLSPVSTPRNGDMVDGSEVSVILHKSSIINTRRQFRELAVGNPEIADVVPLSRNRFYVLGKAIGSTNIVLTDSRGQVIDIIDVLVGYDVQSLKRKIYEVAPDDAVEVRTANNSIVLSGSVDSAEKAGRISALAERYAPDRVTNMLNITGSQQVMLQVKFAEVQRSALKDIGTRLRLTDLDGGGFNSFIGVPGEFGGSTSGGINPLAFFSGGAALVSGSDFSLSAAFDALEEKGLVRTLAEPNIIALSGDTASFLAGGEFPIPVAQESDAGGITITIEFKEFGVGLAFTPTVLDREKVNLELRAEVSSIDPTVSVETQDITIPGLKVRRTNTTVELLDGQSFAIAGLIQDDLETAVRQIPGLGSVPILGALARSQDFQRRQTELVVIITARLVQPVGGDRLAAPTDHFLPPKEFDMFLFGRTYEVTELSGAGGVDGQYGYEQP
ncbi:type II and III secretion system protein family protein [Hyphomonas sp. UBA4494]|jgi:pilus assembly protein CpaC|uniref:type II and III secretion system protein family protein n=1 Tax=Hyphomonas sp. UBA4494 TaxID=1946631 RepID=UPI0025BCA98A|nr:type II and III secretion system protein family protein [Hyphomonas sp. UBA4494]